MVERCEDALQARGASTCLVSPISRGFNVTSAGKPSTGWFTGLPSPSAGMTLAVYYPFSQTEWYRASVAYLDLQHQGLVVLMLLLAVLMVSNVKYPKFPPIGLRSAKGIFGAFGIVRATVLGLMERQEQTVPVEEHLAEAGEPARAVGQAGPPIERRAGWTDRRQQSEE